MHQAASTNQELSSVHERSRRKNAEELIICYFQKKAKCEPDLLLREGCETFALPILTIENCWRKVHLISDPQVSRDVLMCSTKFSSKFADAEGIQFELDRVPDVPQKAAVRAVRAAMS